MRRQGALLGLGVILFFLLGHLLLPIPFASADAGEKKLIFDKAKLLTEEEYAELNTMANEYAAKRDTDFIILTTNNDLNLDVVLITEKFYDTQAPGYDKPHGNTAILTLDMKNREVYLAGFYKAEKYLDDERLDRIRSKITAEFSEGNYGLGFEKFIRTSYKYMGFEPGVDPDNILFNVGFQVIAALVMGGLVVGIMAARTGGRVTVNRHTYENAQTSGVVDREDRFIRTSVTKQKIEKSSSSSGGGGGGGGGTTSGGHSHSGSRGSF